MILQEEYVVTAIYANPLACMSHKWSVLKCVTDALQLLSLVKDVFHTSDLLFSMVLIYFKPDGIIKNPTIGLIEKCEKNVENYVSKFIFP